MFSFISSTRRFVVTGLAVAGLSAAMALPVQAASLIGSSATVEWHYDTFGTIFVSSGPTIVGGGVEFPTSVLGNQDISIDITANQVIVQFEALIDPVSGFAGEPWGDFNGFVIKFTNAPGIAYAAVNGESSLKPVSFSFSSDELIMNFFGQALVSDPEKSNAVITLRFDDPSPTPIPGALPLFASGLGAIGLVTWRRKRKTS